MRAVVLFTAIRRIEIRPAKATGKYAPTISAVVWMVSRSVASWNQRDGWLRAWRKSPPVFDFSSKEDQHDAQASGIFVAEWC